MPAVTADAATHAEEPAEETSESPLEGPAAIHVDGSQVHTIRDGIEQRGQLARLLVHDLAQARTAITAGLLPPDVLSGTPGSVTYERAQVAGGGSITGGDRDVDPKRLEALLYPSEAVPFGEADFAVDVIGVIG